MEAEAETGACRWHVQVPNVEAIWDHLMNMPAAEMQKKADLMHKYRFYMTFNVAAPSACLRLTACDLPLITL